MAAQASRGSIPPLHLHPRPPARCCPAAARFGVFVDELVGRLAPQDREPTEVAINQAKLALLERWWAERNGAEAAHRDRLADSHGAVCLYGLFLDGLARIADIQLRVAPPQLTKPPSSPRQPRLLPPATTLRPQQAMGLFVEDD